MARRILVLAAVMTVAALLAPGAVQAASGVFDSATATAAVKATNTSGSSGAKAVEGTASANTSNTNYGVTGTSKSPNGYGLFGQNLAGTGNAWGMYGRSSSVTGRGVEGYASSTGAGVHYGVLGSAQGTFPDISGVSGVALATTGFTNGVTGRSNSSSGNGLVGTALGPEGWGVFGEGGQFGMLGAGAIGVVGDGASIGVSGTSGAFANGSYGVHADTDLGITGHIVGTAGDVAGVCTVAAGQTQSPQCSFTHPFPASKGKPIVILTPRASNPNAFFWVMNVADGASNWVGLKVRLSAAQGSAKEFNWVVVGLDTNLEPAVAVAQKSKSSSKYERYVK